MAYKSIDELQNTLRGTVFRHTQDSKKAAGRALGTLIEIITYYLTDYWKLNFNMSIERGLEEYGNPEITHKVEFLLHPILAEDTLTLPVCAEDISAKMIASQLKLSPDYTISKNKPIDRNGILRNACVIAESDAEILIMHLLDTSGTEVKVKVTHLSRKPYAMFECKRVGVEEGSKRGPQTIEKAKQGAYVAKMTSSLQKIRTSDGERYGLLYENGNITTKPYYELLHEIIYKRPSLPADFILSTGVVSNHGNWFTNEDQSKELKVLAQSYDWLLFLTDNGLAQFVTDLLLEPANEYKCVRKAFLDSYKDGKKQNRFTKVKMDKDAHEALRYYFKTNYEEIEKWFNVISPVHKTMKEFREELQTLTIKANRL